MMAVAAVMMKLVLVAVVHDVGVYVIATTTTLE